MSKSNKEPPIAYIDGENFSFRVADILISNGRIKEKNDLAALNIRQLLEKSLGCGDLIIRYYGARVRLVRNTPELEAKTEKFINRNRALRNSLSKQNIEFIESGKLKARDGDTCKKCGNQDLHLQEKGVDVKIAVDMIGDSFSGRQLYLVSSDTDLLPAIKASNADITYVALSGGMTQAICKAVGSKMVVLRESEVIDAFDKANPQAPLPLKTPN